MTKKLEAKTKYLEYLNSPEWKELRSKAYERAGDMCELCGHSAGAVHHIEYPKTLEDDELSNLLVVCELCHDKLHGKRIGNYRKKKDPFNGKVCNIDIEITSCDSEGEANGWISFTARIHQIQNIAVFCAINGLTMTTGACNTEMLGVPKG